MAVTKREYNDQTTRRPIWGYDFTWNCTRYRKAGYVSRAEALRAEADARERVNAGHRIRPIKGVTFNELFNEFIVDFGKHQSWRNTQREEMRGRGLVRELGDKYSHRLVPADIERYVTQREKAGKQPTTINREIALLRKAFQYGLHRDRGYVITNPAREVPYRKWKRTRRVIPTPEQFRDFIRAAEQTRTGRELVVWLWVRALVGLRPSECLFLEWPEILFDRDLIKVVSKPDKGSPLKKDAERDIEMHPNVKEILLGWREHWESVVNELPAEDQHQWVFYHPLRPKERVHGFRTAFENAREKAGLPHLRSYDLRHMFCSFALMNGIDKDVVRQWMGHKSFQMIDEVYTHFLDDYRRQQMRKLRIDLPDDCKAEPAQRIIPAPTSP
jgi:integrase